MRTLLSTSKESSSATVPSLDDFLQMRDYSGALTLLDFSSKRTDKLLWKAYCSFHNRDYETAQKLYLGILAHTSKKDGHQHQKSDSEDDDSITLYLACSYFHMKMYQDATEKILEYKGASPLKTRLASHLSKRGFTIHDFEGPPKSINLTETSIHDEMSHAAILYLDGNYQEAAEAYKRLLHSHPNFVALNLFVAMCYFKLNYFDVAQETLAIYEQTGSACILCRNLKACIKFHLYDGMTALEEFTGFESVKFYPDSEIIRHNTVIFHDGKSAHQVLSLMLDSLPEARLNLAIYYLTNGDIHNAWDLLKKLKPKSVQEYVVKGAVSAAYGQLVDDHKILSEAKDYFEFVGSSPTEMDTIPGRQSMASFLFLQKKYSEAIVYLSSIQNYLSDDDDFNWNYGLSLAASKDYTAAEEILLRIKGRYYLDDLAYKLWLARCFVKNNKAVLAWQLFLNVEDVDSVAFLKVLADECYLAGSYDVACKAFKALQEIDQDSDYTVGLKSSCIGIFHSAVNIVSKGNILPIEKRKELNESIDIMRIFNLDELGIIIPRITRWMDDYAT